MVISEWLETPTGNIILETDEGEPLLISYRDFSRNNPFNDFSFFNADDGGEETALNFQGRWYILNGDFREQYKAAFPNPVACIQVFLDNRELRSTWSTDDGDNKIADLMDWIMKQCQH